MQYEEFRIKKKSGKLRKIVSPDAELKAYQRIAKHKLNHLLKRLLRGSGVTENFHGFMPGCNAVTAATKHIGFKTTIMFDLVDFFDSVKKDMFDPDTFESLDLDPSLLFHRRNYAAQGFPSSPTLANMASIKMIKDIKTFLASRYVESTVTIYADDIQISVNTENLQEITRIKNTVEEIAIANSFSINKRKTRVRYHRHGYRRILGLNVNDKVVRATRKTMRRLRSASHNPSISQEVYRGIQEWSTCKPPHASLIPFTL